MRFDNEVGYNTLSWIASPWNLDGAVTCSDLSEHKWCGRSMESLYAKGGAFHAM
eukprot:SAG11_NODE_19182_length_472_cov_1.190349_1_plen_53_part_01